LLFVLAADLLQSIVNQAAERGLHHPLSDRFGGDFPIVQYADDTLLFLQADARKLFLLKGLLRSFCDSTSLQINFAKSLMAPINVSEEKTAHLARTFGCAVGSLPFTYLGLPLGTTRTAVTDFMPLICRIERRLAGLSQFLSYYGRLTLVNSLLTSLPMYWLSTFKFLKSVIKQIDTFRKNCLWEGNAIHRQGRCLVAWTKACKSKQEGGLGILDIKAQNKALLLKLADKFYNNCDTPWVQLTWQALYSNPVAPHAKRLVGSFWWQDVMSLSLVFRSFASCEVGNGRTVCFWEDIWNGRLLKLDFPQLHSFARDHKVSVKAFMSRAPEDNFLLPCR
jgi:hypothetical protein